MVAMGPTAQAFGQVAVILLPVSTSHMGVSGFYACLLELHHPADADHGRQHVPAPAAESLPPPVADLACIPGSETLPSMF